EPSLHPVHRPVGRPHPRGGGRPCCRLGLRRARDRRVGRAPGRLALGRRRLHRRSARDPRAARPRGVGDLQPPHRPGGVRRPHRLPPPGHRRLTGVGRRGPRRRPCARSRGAAAHRAAGAATRRRHRGRVHRLVRVAVRRHVPTGPGERDRGRLPGLRRPVEPHPRRVRRVRGPVRARGAPQRDRLRLLDHGADAGGHRPPARLRAQLGPQPHDVAGPRPGGVHHRLRRPDLPRRLQGHPDAARCRPQRSAVLAPALGPPAPGLGLRHGRARRRALGGLLPGARCDRLRRPHLDRVGGRRHGPPAGGARGAGPPSAVRLRPPDPVLRRRVRPGL
ncbi:MAG: Inosose isomerase, partial [uncultured Nocardioides sp.]